MANQKRTPLDPVETKETKAAVYDLSEKAAKQLLYGMIQILSFKSSIIKEQFLEILDDARKYGAMTNGRS